MRALSDYRLADWSKGTPLVHGVKRARNVVTERIFRGLPARGYDAFMADLAARRPDVLAITIAYNTPWVIDVMTQVTPPNINGTLVVCDNSRQSAARREIARICKDRGVPYLALPFNLEHHPCRSHGIALNWAYYNIVAQREAARVRFSRSRPVRDRAPRSRRASRGSAGLRPDQSKRLGLESVGGILHVRPCRDRRLPPRLQQ